LAHPDLEKAVYGGVTAFEMTIPVEVEFQVFDDFCLQLHCPDGNAPEAGVILDVGAGRHLEDHATTAIALAVPPAAVPQRWPNASKVSELQDQRRSWDWQNYRHGFLSLHTDSSTVVNIAITLVSGVAPPNFGLHAMATGMPLKSEEQNHASCHEQRDRPQ
jgi:hypothetical protein